MYAELGSKGLRQKVMSHELELDAARASTAAGAESKRRRCACALGHCEISGLERPGDGSDGCCFGTTGNEPLRRKGGLLVPGSMPNKAIRDLLEPL